MLSSDDQAALAALRERLRSSIVDGDAATYAACFAEEGVIMHPDSPPVQGRTAIAEYGAGMFEMVEITLLNLTPVSVVGDGDLAYEVGTQECVVEPALPGFKRERQHLHVYHRADDGAWYVAAAMSGNQ